MFNIVLVEPEIPANSGNIIRLCANSGASLHLIKPLGFTLDDRKLKRAGLDYHEWARIEVHDSLQDYIEKFTHTRLLACSTHGTNCYTTISYQKNDSLIFGAETRGLPKAFLASLLPAHVLRIPMQKNSRSLNLSNSVAIVLYEAWRQLEFAGDSI